MKRRCLTVCMVGLMLALAGAARSSAEPTLDGEKRSPAAVAATIDAAIVANLKEHKIAVSPLANDAEFLRRVYLDVCGRIPTVIEAKTFLDCSDADKRPKLVDQLLASDDFGRNFANVWHDLIVPRTPIHNDIKPEQLRLAFADNFNRNTPWNELVTRLLLCNDGDEQSNFLAFYRINGDMGGKPMANVASRSFARLFLGLKLECAECHDDPHKPWKQAEYWGLAAFFGRVAVYEDKNTKVKTRIVEGAGYKPPKGNNFRLEVKKDGALVIHVEAQTNVGASIAPAVLGGPEQTAPAGTEMLPLLAKWVAAPENPYLAPAAVNRFWSHFFARGLVNPVDDFHSGNPPTHPEVLDLLGEEFRSSGFDVKHLIRCICLTQAYQRTSQPVSGNEQFDDPRYARMPLKMLTAEMLLASLQSAFEEPELVPVNPKPIVKRGPIPFSRADFIRLFQSPDAEASPEEYHHGIVQTLHLLNTPAYNTGGSRIKRLAGSDARAEQVVEELYLATLSRRPTDTELARKLKLIGAHESPQAGYAGVLWTLVTQSEFVLNH